MSIAILLTLSFLAGFIDAIAGGGGLIQLPALFSIFPLVPIPQLMGTNKFAMWGGTCIASWNYVKRIELEFKILLPAAIFAFFFSFLGSYGVTKLDPSFLKPLIFFLLIGVLIYTVINKDLNKLHQFKLKNKHRMILGVFLGAVIGFYDGFFGPGTGSFLIVLFIAVFGLNFLNASGSSKIVNLGTNLASLIWFLPTGNIIWEIAIPMCLFNILGGQVGSRLAISRGNYFVRSVFITVVSILIAKMGYDLITE